MSDLISRQVAIDAMEKIAELYPWRIPGNRDTYDRYNEAWQDAVYRMETEIEQLPSAQPERDIPRKPNETIDRTWGKENIQAVCPKCDYYLGHVVFLEDSNGKSIGKHITYCESCGQAIDWSGWDERFN